MEVISVENVSKKFILAHDRPKHLADGLRSLLWRTKREDFWALKDVSFEVEAGEALGIIGHNGAGKSTMLKLLTRIMEPTKGRIRTRGRVSALIEVGAGFHPEMTGRENIYLNGAILGMTRREIDRKFDEIVEFAELEKFIDTPVKRYSSGMYVRLGFAVAAHVQPDLLMVDEVLSVGDANFQGKCSARMSDLRHSGVTIVFVSHNLGYVESFCPRTLVLDHGQVTYAGDSRGAINLYLSTVRHEDTNWEALLPITSAAITVEQAEIRDGSGLAAPHVREGDDLVITIRFTAHRNIEDPCFAFGVHDGRLGTLCFGESVGRLPADAIPKGPGECQCTFHAPPLRPRGYEIWFAVRSGVPPVDLIPWQRLMAARLVEREGKVDDLEKVFAPVAAPFSFQIRTASTETTRREPA